MARRTIEQEVAVAGVGLHTGAPARVTLQPAPAGQGVVFRRMDLAGQPVIPARLSQVSETERRTAIGEGDQTIHTVEHVLAAVFAAGIDDLTIALDGPEPPALDGSFVPYVELVASAGTREQPGDAATYRVAAPFHVTEGEASYVISPAKSLRITATIEWEHPLIGRQAATFDITPEEFARELAPARTFGFLEEVTRLKESGLALGGTSENAIILTDDGIATGPLRWHDEFVRHKIADVVGDLALLGGRIHAHIIATRPSHRGNLALARAISRTGQREGGIAMDIGQILDVIPHRYPFLLVDRIIEVEGTKRIVGIKNVTINEPFFQGHFPGHPIMPGVLIIEAMAQVGGMLLLTQVAPEDRSEKVVYFMSLDNVKFRRPVLPGDQLRCELEMVQFRGKTCRMNGVAYVDGHVVCEAEMMARIVDR